MKVNIREFKHIVRNIIKEEMEKVDEDFGTSVDYKYAKGYGNELEDSKEDIETPQNKSFKKSEIPQYIINRIKEFFGYEVSDAEIKEKLRELTPKEF